MNNEFKKFKSSNETRYVLETATAGATSSGAVATSAGSMGKMQKRNPDNILAQEADTIKVPVKQKPRQGPLRQQTGAGQHRDKKKEMKQGKEKHRKPFAENSLAEGLTPERRARLDDLISQFSDSVDPSDYGSYMDSDEIIDTIRKEFGDKIARQVEAGAEKMHFPRPGHTSWKADPLGWKRPVDRQTKAGKMYKQDSDYRKNTIKSRYALGGKSATEDHQKPDHEISMASNELQSIVSDAKKLLMLVKRYSEMEGLEAWQQSKITKAADYVASVLRSIGGEQGALEGLRDPKDNPCWKGYKPVGTKQKGGRTVPNCVPKEGVAEEQGYDEVSPKSASYILRKLDQGVPMSNILDDFPELGRMMEIIAGEHGLHPDDDFEQIEDILQNDLEDIAAQEDDFGDYDQDEAPDEYMESLAQSLNAAITEKAVSKAQQRFMGMVHAAQKGKKPASKEVAKAAKGMGKKDAKDFASTKHKGLPEKKPKK